MKILQIITKSELGGAQSVVSMLANSLCESHEVMVVAGEGDGKIWDIIDDRVAKKQCPMLKGKISLGKDMAAICFLRKLYRSFQPDIVHLHSSKAGLLGRLAFPKERTVYTVHGFDSLRLAHHWLIPLERQMQKRCAAIVGVSRHDVVYMEREGITRNVSYIYNTSLPVAKDPSLGLPGSGKHAKTILCIARISYPKRFDLFTDIARRMPQYGFVWIGNQYDIPDIPDNVTLMGNIVGASQYCHHADLVILPSDYEGLPIVLIEAMAAGKPIVASRVGGIPEIVEDGKNGFTADNTADDFCQRISQVLTNDDLQRRMGENSRSFYENNLTVEKMVNAYKDLYNSIYRKTH